MKQSRLSDDGAQFPGANLLGDLGRDIRYAVRSLLRARAFSAIGIIIIALGVGATAAVGVVTIFFSEQLSFVPDVVTQAFRGSANSGNSF